MMTALTFYAACVRRTNMADLFLHVPELVSLTHGCFTAEQGRAKANTQHNTTGKVPPQLGIATFVTGKRFQITIQEQSFF